METTAPLLHQTVGELLERSIRAYPDRVAVIHGDRRVTYAELGTAVRRAGRALRALGLERGDRVALLSGDRVELLVAFYATLWSGLAIVPLNARMAEEDLAHVVGDSGARVLVHDAQYRERAARIVAGSAVEHLVAAEPGSAVAGGHELAALAEVQEDGPVADPASPGDLAAVFYTGGTTGRPKGVQHTQAALVAAFVSEALEMGLGEREVFAHAAPLTHASGMFCVPVWMRGGTNLVLGGFDPQQLLDAIERERVTAMLLVPTMLYVILDQPDLAERDLSSLRTVIYGAAPMGRERLLQAIERFGPIFTQLYGQTEAPNQLCVLSRADHADAVASGDLSILGSCGRPVTIADVRVVDGEGNECPVGVPGEIVARGPHVMLGYRNLPEQTAETLIDGWLHTGDIAQRDERGFIHIVDRKKDMIISGGFNVYPKEVEQALFQHPHVRDACVIGIPDEKWGETVKAVVVADDPSAVTEAELIAWVKERKGAVVAPKSVDLVDAIPLTAVGKHDKPALRKAYWGGRERAVN